MKTVRVKLFGLFRPYGPGGELVLEFEEGATLADVRAGIVSVVAAKNPAHGKLVAESALATYGGPSPKIIKNSAEPVKWEELAILPPVCGG